MSKNKTQPTQHSTDSFLEKIKDPARKEDCQALISLMSGLTDEKPVIIPKNSWWLKLKLGIIQAWQGIIHFLAGLPGLTNL